MKGMVSHCNRSSLVRPHTQCLQCLFQRAPCSTESGHDDSGNIAVASSYLPESANQALFTAETFTLPDDLFHHLSTYYHTVPKLKLQPQISRRQILTCAQTTSIVDHRREVRRQLVRFSFGSRILASCRGVKSPCPTTMRSASPIA